MAINFSAWLPHLHGIHIVAYTLPLIMTQLLCPAVPYAICMAHQMDSQFLQSYLSVHTAIGATDPAFSG